MTVLYLNIRVVHNYKYDNSQYLDTTSMNYEFLKITQILNFIYLFYRKNL